MLKRYTKYRVAKDGFSWRQERVEPVMGEDVMDRDDITKAIRLARRLRKKDPNARYVVECWWVYRLEGEEANFDTERFDKTPTRAEYRCTVWDSDTQPA